MWSRIPCTHGPLKKTVPPCYHAGIILLPSCWYYNDLMSLQCCSTNHSTVPLYVSAVCHGWHKCNNTIGIHVQVWNYQFVPTGTHQFQQELGCCQYCASFLLFWKVGVQEKCHVLNHVHSCLQPIPTEPPPHECRLARTDWHTGMAIRYILGCTKGGDWFLHKAPK